MNEGKRIPFLLLPAGKDYLWGGRRLKDDFAKELPLKPLAETWECSTHPDGCSLIASGEYSGRTLAEVLQEYPDYLGTHPAVNGGLPILVKLIDAKENLSVQVHPDDDYAKEHENGQLGKSEMWYVLDAVKNAKLVYGLKKTVGEEELREAIKAGRLEEYLQYVPVQKGNVFFVEAGTVHAIGAGTLVAEIQENSNLTYRLYDYSRRDKQGRYRAIHVDKALAVAKLKREVRPRQPIRVLRYRLGCAAELLCRCKYFEVHRLLLNTERLRGMVYYQSDDASFRVLLCVDGCGSVFSDDEKGFCFFKGDCIFFPANSVKIKLHGKAEFLDVRC